MHWIYLLIASSFEICWLYCLKFLKWSDVPKIRLFPLDQFSQYLPTIFPLVGYIAFGILNMVFYSMAMKTISVSTAFAVWLSISLIGSKLVDISIFKEPYTIGQLFFLGVILAGIIGLQVTSTK